MTGGATDTRRDEATPSLSPFALTVVDPDYEFDRAATQKMPAAQPPAVPSLLRLAALSMLAGGSLATIFLAVFGGRLARTTQATRATASLHVEAAAPPPAPEVASPEHGVDDPPASDAASGRDARPAGETSGRDARPAGETSGCESALADLGAQRAPLCAWLVSRAEGRPAGAPPVVAIRMLLARDGARKIAGRVVRDALDPGVYQITSSGVWGYCLRAEACPTPGPDGVFWMWTRRSSDRASVQVFSGRVEDCVLLEEAPAGAASDLASMPDGPEARAVASRVLAALTQRR